MYDDRYWIITVIILQYMQTLNHYVICLKLMFYGNYTSVKQTNKKLMSKISPSKKILYNMNFIKQILCVLK